jgi:hypothetical protein
LTSWPAFKEGNEAYLEFGDSIAAKTSLHKKQLDFLTDFTANQREHGAITTSR